MIKPLEDAPGRVLRLSEQKQAVAAELLEQFAQSDAAPYAPSADERAAVREAPDRTARGQFAPEAKVEGALRRPWD